MIISDAAPSNNRGEGLVLMWWGKSAPWLTYLPPPLPTPTSLNHISSSSISAF